MRFDVLDWSAGPFLGLYVLLAAASVAMAVAVKEWVRSRAASGPGPVGELSVLEVALLSGGRARAADVLALGLVESGHLAVNPAGHLAATALYRDAPPQIGPFRSERQIARRDLVAVMRPWLDPAVESLVFRGLALSEKLQSRMRLAIISIVTPVILLGIVRIGFGLQRDRPVGFLVGLVIVTTFATIVAAHVRRLATGLGDDVLSSLIETKRRALLAPLPQEVLFAFAMHGPPVLSGTALAAYAKALKDGSGSGGCGGDGGGGGGGGCGGCGGGH